MPDLNPHQFGREPDETLYNHYDDYLRDKKRYDRSVAAGKPFVDHDAGVIKEQRTLDERGAKGELKQSRERTAKTTKNMRTVSRTLSAFGMKPKRSKRWF